jgi:hypothetical protein
VLRLQELTHHAADTIPTHPVSRVKHTSVLLRPLDHLSGQSALHCTEQRPQSTRPPEDIGVLVIEQAPAASSKTADGSEDQPQTSALRTYLRRPSRPANPRTVRIQAFHWHPDRWHFAGLRRVTEGPWDHLVPDAVQSLEFRARRRDALADNPLSALAAC